jgi:hypothetical protein
MSEENRKLRKLIGVNFAVLALLLVTSGFTLTGCKQAPLKRQSTEQPKPTQELKKNQPTDAKSKKDQDYEKQGQDSQEDDDPE